MTENRTYPHNIVAKFGGLRAMSRITGYPISTISSWLSRGAIHDEHKPRILERGMAEGIGLKPEDFFPRLPEAIAPTAAR